MVIGYGREVSRGFRKRGEREEEGQLHMICELFGDSVDEKHGAWPKQWIAYNWINRI